MKPRIQQEEIESKVASAEAIVGHEFSNRSLLETAITHPSASEEEESGHDYERLEFLGDSIVGAIIASEIFKRFPEMDEGGMTRIKVSLVSGATLSEVSSELGIDRVIIFGGSECGTGKRGLHSALENVYESITAALYLDGGLPVARSWVLRTLAPRISESNALEPESPKSTLQEVLQEQRITPTYQITEIGGPPHDRTFTAIVLAGEETVGSGKGHSKKEAESQAARDALDRMGRL